MKAYVNEKLKIVVNGIETNIELNDELLNKIELQTDITYLILINGKLIFNKITDQVMNELRKIRDKELSKTDYLFFSDNSYLTTTTEKTELKAKRKYLRDITEGLTTVEQVLQKIKELN